jgi:hypothetical protein
MMGVEINSSIIWKQHDWVVTEAIPGISHQCFARVELDEEEVVKDKLNWSFLAPDQIEEGTTRLSKSYWYPMSGLANGIYFAKSAMRPRDEVKLWLRIEDKTIVSQSLNYAQALNWFGETEATISFQCGHIHTVKLHGSPARVHQAAIQMSHWDCRDCYRTAKYLIAFQTAQKLNLPLLQGSFKQVEWAEQIRSKVLQDLLAWEAYWDEFLAKLQESGIADEDAYCVIQLKAIVDAKFWIDHQDYDLFQLLKLVDRDYC